MNSKQTLFVAVGLLLSLGMAFVAVSRPAQVVKEVSNPVNFGAVSGPDITFNDISIGGINYKYVRQPLRTATSTPCSIPTPSATSTVVSAGVKITTASSTATTWHLAGATTAFATTTNLFTYSLGSGAFGNLVYTGTTTGVDTKNEVAPATFLVWGAAGFLPADTTKLNGFCQAVFRINKLYRFSHRPKVPYFSLYRRD